MADARASIRRVVRVLLICIVFARAIMPDMSRVFCRMSKYSRDLVSPR